MIENFQLFLNVVVYFLNFSGIICMMFVITSNFSYFTMVNQIFYNWSLGPIEDIKIFEKIKSEKEYMCPDNYEYLFKFQFPGTKSGCNCLNIFNMTGYTEFENKLLPGSCSLMLVKFGCQTVPDLPSKTLHSILDKFYCIRRKEFNYLQNYRENIFDISCPTGRKSCGIIDSVGNLLCIELEKECAINGNEKNIDSLNYININRNNFTKISYSFLDTPQLIQNISKNFIQFSLSQGLTCINNDEINLNQEDIHELFNSRKTMKCATQLFENNLKFKYDTRYKPLAMLSTDSVFYKEDFIKTNLETLPKFPKSYFTSPIIISGRNYIGWHKKCKDFIFQFHSMHKLSQKIENYSIFYLIYSLVMLIYCMLFIMIFKELIYEQYTLKICIILIHVLMILVLFYLVLADYLEITKYLDLCFLIIKKRCSDEETNRLILFVLDVFRDIARLYMITIILDIIMILLSIIKIMLTLYKLYKRSILERLIQGRTDEYEMMLIM